jgi:hypothetical protein
MSYRVSVRNLITLVEQINSEGIGSIVFPQECEKNSKIIKNILGYVPKVLPNFSKFDEQDITHISNLSAYTLRPDLVLCPGVLFGPPYLRPTIQIGKKTDTISLRNNPEDLHPDFRLENTETNRRIGAEFFRSYCGAFEMLNLTKNIDLRKVSGEGSMSIAFSMADVTAYLLNPNDLTVYTYEKGEIGNFEAVLAKQIESI